MLLSSPRAACPGARSTQPAPFPAAGVSFVAVNWPDDDTSPDPHPLDCRRSGADRRDSCALAINEHDSRLPSRPRPGPHAAVSGGGSGERTVGVSPATPPRITRMADGAG